MKRVYLVELGIIVVAIILGCRTIIGLIDILTILLLTFSTDNGFGDRMLVYSVFPLVLYLCATYLLLRYKKPLARLFNGKDSDSETAPITLGGKDVIQAVIVVLSLSILVTEIPSIIYNIFEKDALTMLVGNVENSIFISTIKCAIAIVLLFFSRRIAVALASDTKTS